MTSILKLQGFNDNNDVSLTPNGHGRPRIGLISCYNILNRTGIDQSLIKPLMMFGGRAAQPLYSIPEDAKLVFNEISNPDVHPTALERAADLCERAKLPVINPPEKVQYFTLDKVSKILQDIPGVTTPKTVRFKPRTVQDVFDQAIKIGLEFPFIIRIAGNHAGITTTLIHGTDDEKSLHRYSFANKNFYLTEFINYSDHSGLYRKQRIIFIAGEPFARDVLFDKQWNVAATSRTFMLQHPEHGVEAELVGKLAKETLPGARPALLEIGQRVELDYFGLDCHINSDGHVLIFKASANVNFLYPETPGLEPQLELIRGRLREMINRKAGWEFQ